MTITHEHVYTRSKPGATVETCACGKWRHTENAGPSIIAQEAAPIKRAPRLPRGESYTCARCERDHAPVLPPLAADGVTPLSWQECTTPELRAAWNRHNDFRDHRTYDARGERGQALRRLREWVKPGDKLYTVLRRRSSSGMCRHISVLKPDPARPGEMLDLTFNAARALDWRMDRDTGGLVVGGCGMDMGFHAVYSLSSALYPDGYDCTGENCPGNDHVNARETNCALCGETLPKKGALRRKVPGRSYTVGVCSRKCQRATWHHRDGGYALRQGWI